MAEQVLWVEDDGAVVYFDHDDVTDETKIRVQRDVEPLLEANKAAFNEGLVNRASEFRRVGSYTAHAMWLFGQMRGLGERWADIMKRGNEELLCDMVHERDLRGFRTLPGDFRANFKRR